MQSGVTGAYEWLEIDYGLRAFVQLCPEVVVGNYVAITSFDSGFYFPCETDLAKGWHSAGNIAYSPRLGSADELPPDCCGSDSGGYDEWYVFADPRELGELCRENVFTTAVVPGTVFALINFCGFQLSEPEMQPVTDLFWKQIEWMQPESYIGDGQQCLVFASRNRALFATVRNALEGSLHLGKEDCKLGM
jgi:hypothetical protein